MKTISLQKAHSILEYCSAIIIEDYVLVYPSLSDLTGEDDNQWLYISWSDDKGREFDVEFIEENNKDITISGSTLFLKDNEGEEFQVTILVPEILE